jgi:hypothetical protein
VLSYRVDSKDWVTEHASGTSLAAPLVSFTAALVQSEGKMAPQDLKRRLLVSADLRPELAGHVADGRLLNVVKALALFDDVVEQKASGRLALGALTLVQGGKALFENHALDLVCDGVPTPVKMADLFKLVPQFKKADGRVVTKVYSRPPDGVARPFEDRECAVPTDVSVKVTDAETGVVTELALAEVADIVRKSR